MLGRDEDPLDLDRPLAFVLVDLVPNGHLRLAVGPQIWQLTHLANLGQTLADLVREHDRKRHQLRRLTGRVAEHHSLVAGADAVERVVVAGVVLDLVRGIDALRDVRRLLVDRDHDAARGRIEAPLGMRVTDLRDLPSHLGRDVDVRLGRNLAGDDDETGRDQRLTGDPAAGIVGEHGVEDGVGDLVGDLVGMSLRDRFGCEQEVARHGREGYLIVWKPEIRSASPSLTR